MSIVNQVLAFDPILWSWNTIGGRYRDLTNSPRAEISFNEKQTVTAPGVGNEAIINAAFALPVNYAYVLVECSVIVQVAVAGDTNNYDDEGLIQIVSNANQFLPMQSRGMVRNFGGATDFVESKMYTLVDTPSHTMIESTGGQVALAILIANNVQDNQAYTVRPYLRFFQYDYEQAQYMDVNNAIPTRST